MPLTAALLREKYLELNREYYGKEFELDPEIGLEYLRVPHFYYNFYVYQYATGISASYALVEGLMKEGEEARKRYLKFLSSGSSKYPLELLEIAGVKMDEKAPIESLIRRFRSLVDELEREME